MSVIKSEDAKKWINAFIVIVSILVGFVLIRFTEQLGEWFDLEAKISNFIYFTQGIGIFSGLLTWILIFKNKNAMRHLNEVYSELVKVIWPEKDIVMKLTIGIIIGVAIMSTLFVAVDFSFQKLLDLIY